MMYSAYKFIKQGDNIQPWHTPFPIWNQSVVPCPVPTVASWPAYKFLKRQSGGLVFPTLSWWYWILLVLLILKIFISLSNLNESSAGWSILGCSFSPFIILTISCHPFLACRASSEKEANNFMGFVPFPLLIKIFFFFVLKSFSV